MYKLSHTHTHKLSHTLTHVELADEAGDVVVLEVERQDLPGETLLVVHVEAGSTLQGESQRTSVTGHQTPDMGYQTWDIRHGTSDKEQQTQNIRHKVTAHSTLTTTSPPLVIIHLCSAGTLKSMLNTMGE